MDFTRLIKDRTSGTCVFCYVHVFKKCRTIQMLTVVLHAGLNDRKSSLQEITAKLFQGLFIF